MVMMWSQPASVPLWCFCIIVVYLLQLDRCGFICIALHVSETKVTKIRLFFYCNRKQFSRKKKKTFRPTEQVSWDQNQSPLQLSFDLSSKGSLWFLKKCFGWKCQNLKTSVSFCFLHAEGVHSKFNFNGLHFWCNQNILTGCIGRLCELYLPSSTSKMFSGRWAFRVSGSRKTRLPLKIPVPAKMSGGRRSQTSSSSITIGASELPIRQRHEV